MKKWLDGSWMAGAPLWEWKFIRGYPLMIFLGILFSFLTVAYFWKRYKYSWDILQMLVIITIPLAIFGARFYTLVVDGGWENWYVLSGLSIYGALIFSIPSGCLYIWFKRHMVDFKTIFSIVVPTILIGQTIGRWGNFFNHEVYGDIVTGESLNWTTFIKPHMHINHHYRAPLFLYEFMLSLTGYIIIVWFLNRKSVFKPGITGGLYMIWYGVERLILQLFRDETQTSWLDANKTIPVNLIVSILFITIGIILILFFQFSKKLKQYTIIYPIKPRRKFLFVGNKIKTKGKYFLFFGPQIPNKIKLYIPKNVEKKWSKRELNKGKRN